MKKLQEVRKHWIEIRQGKTVKASNAEVCEQRDWKGVAKTGPCPFTESPNPPTHHLPLAQMSFRTTLLVLRQPQGITTDDNQTHRMKVRLA